jgi:hypothetical protein
MIHQVRFQWSLISDTNASIPFCSFKLHATTQQLHDWVQSEKMKLTSHGGGQMSKERLVRVQGDHEREE